MMRPSIRLSTLLAIIATSAAWCPRAFAQTTQPSPRAWDLAVSEVASELAAGDGEALHAHLMNDCQIRTIASKSPAALEDLLGMLTGQTVLAARAYVSPPGNLAADLAADAAGSAAPDGVKKMLAIPDDDDQRKIAADTAVKWVTTTLNLGDGDPVGVIAFYSDGGNSTHPVFVLIKGVEVATDQYKIAAVVFGDPLGE